VRIVQVAPFFHPHAGGVESHVRSIAREFAREGHEVTVVTSKFRRGLPGDERMEGYRVVRSRTLGVALNTPFDFGQLSSLDRLRADVVHLHYPPPLTSFFATRWLARHPRVPVCLTYHCDLFLDGLAGRALAGLYQRVFVPPTLRAVDRIIVHTRSYGVTSTVLRGRPLEVIPSVVDLDWFRPGLDASDLRGDLRLDGKRVLAFTGRLVPHKGVDVILQALTRLPDDVVLLVIGTGPGLAGLVGLARRLRVSDRVRFCVTVTDDDLPRYLSLADVFVFPSQNRLEGFGLVVAEAMAVGLPVVTANMPGVREVIEEGQEGLLAEPLLADDLAAKIRVLIDDPALARRMGAAGRRRVEQRYGLTTVAGQLLSLYASLRAAG
jgi:glycosyltransferase involved in cell wall biosynthesis